jgi:hypothetical protein
MTGAQKTELLPERIAGNRQHTAQLAGSQNTDFLCDRRHIVPQFPLFAVVMTCSFDRWSCMTLSAFSGYSTGKGQDRYFT